MIQFIKDFINYKKLFRYSYNFGFKPYDFKYELAQFWDSIEKQNGGNKQILENLENLNKNRYKQLVSVNGFSYSGSGAVTEFLDEFSECTVLGGLSSYAGRANNDYECLFFVMQDELLSLEEGFLSKRKFFDNRAPLKFSIRVLRNYLNNTYGKNGMYFFDDYYLERSKQFLFDLLDGFEMYHGCYNSMWHYSPPLEAYDKNKKRISRIKPHEEIIVESVWKNISLDEFRSRSKEYMNDILAHIPSKKFLVCDQLFLGCEYDEKLFNDYFGDIKSIYVYRDPRDQYSITSELGSPWTGSSAELFVKFFKSRIGKIAHTKSSNMMMIAFEDFVYNYDKVSAEIADFLGLDQSTHIEKFKYFDPKISIKNIGRHKSYHDQEAIKIIENELKEYCYEQK